MCPNCGGPSPWGLCLRCQGLMEGLNRRAEPYGMVFDPPLTGGNKMEEALFELEKKESSQFAGIGQKREKSYMEEFKERNALWLK